MNAKHTPGPWVLKQFGGPQIGGGKGGVYAVCTMWGEGHFEGKSVDAANARLIAAAPDLLAACEAFVAYDAGDETDGIGLMLAYNRAIEAARAAIARATGEA